MRKYPNPLPPETAIPTDAPNYNALKWIRAHEKKRLAAYLKGHTLFAHGRHVTVTGFAPNMYRVAS